MNYTQLLNSIEDELVFLKKSSGFTLPRVSNLITIPQVMSAENNDFSTLRKKFILLIEKIEEPSYQKILLSLFALNGDYKTIQKLKDRRSKYCFENNISIDHLLEIESALAKDLAKVMFNNSLE